jgi:hypothetical protein
MPLLFSIIVAINAFGIGIDNLNVPPRRPLDTTVKFREFCLGIRPPRSGYILGRARPYSLFFGRRVVPPLSH